MESEVYIPLGCRQTLRAITMASAEGLGSRAVNCLSVQREFLGARLHVQLRVNSLAENMWKWCLWPHLACPVLIHMYVHNNYNLLKEKKKTSKSSCHQLMHLWHCLGFSTQTLAVSTTEPALLTLLWMACTFFITQVHLLKKRVFRWLPLVFSFKIPFLPMLPSFFPKHSSRPPYHCLTSPQ